MTQSSVSRWRSKALATADVAFTGHLVTYKPSESQAFRPSVDGLRSGHRTMCEREHPECERERERSSSSTAAIEQRLSSKSSRHRASSDRAAIEQRSSRQQSSGDQAAIEQRSDRAAIERRSSRQRSNSGGKGQIEQRSSGDQAGSDQTAGARVSLWSSVPWGSLPTERTSSTSRSTSASCTSAH
jgi:hypothetical protein